MENVSLSVPMMYGDHHVLEVRKLLSTLPGIHDIYASSSFQVVEVQFDEAKLTVDEIKETLDQAGYLGEMALPVETGAIAENGSDQVPFFRKTAVHAQTGTLVSFAQKAPYRGRPLWPCPTVGPVKIED